MKYFLTLCAVLFALVTLSLSIAAQEMRSYTDALKRIVGIPANPQRIVSMHDHALTLPLVELGAPVVGSHGRVANNGSAYLRSVNTVMNVDFGNSDIAFIGAFDQIDFEAIASLGPDLIIGQIYDKALLQKLEAIAPTVILDDSKNAIDFYADVADVSGKTKEFKERLAGYKSLVADAQGWLQGPSRYTYSKIQAYDGQLEVYANYGALTKALDDLGFQITKTGQEMRNRGVSWGETVSAEILPAQDADFLFDTYRIDQGQEDSPKAARNRMEEVLPGYCKLLTACMQGRYIFVPREHAAPISFRTLEMNVHYIVSHVMGRPGITDPQ